MNIRRFNELPPELGEQIYGFLHEAELMTLCTVDEKGLPYAAVVFFACDPKLRLYFYSDPHSAHCRHLEREPSVAAGMGEAVEPWDAGVAMQLRGRCTTVESEELERAAARYRDKFPEGTGAAAEIGSITSPRLYRIVPRWVRWMNNWRGFDYRFEIHWPRGELTNLGSDSHDR